MNCRARDALTHLSASGCILSKMRERVAIMSYESNVSRLDESSYRARSKREDFSKNKMGKREYLNDFKTRDFTKSLNLYFEEKVEVPRIRVGKHQTIETLINEEALLFAKYLRDERETWIPRIVLPETS